MRDTPIPEQQRHNYELGGMQAEMNTILARITRRPSGEPTRVERQRLGELKAAIREKNAETR
jgi:hypothetical protein